MTEAEWWAATEPSRPVDWLFFDAHASDRKLRLFSVACCERVRHLVTDPDCRRSLELAEAFADGLVNESELIATSTAGWQRYHVATTATPFLPVAVAAAHSACLHVIAEDEQVRDRDYYEREDTVPDATWVTWFVADAIDPSHLPAKNALRKAELARQIRLLHDIFGPLPFREVPIPPEWLTSDVLALARGIYDEKAFDRMPILADALQDAGCDNDEVLTHCRAANWEHVRGCWVLDLLLGKPWREPEP